MLVFRRRPGRGLSSSFTIGGAVKITVVEIDKQGAKIGIEAPASVPVVRDDAMNARKSQGGGVIDARITQLAAIVANIEAPQFDRVRALAQLVEHCAICWHPGGSPAPQKGDE